ncbi:HAMP domain-containing histidine kinase, partial [Candidatus Gracilibacteria bacterium]|nr:HAMP domain-containing histidine kinase [Candidatus Gracilibacteria bacterium]
GDKRRGPGFTHVNSIIVQLDGTLIEGQGVANPQLREIHELLDEDTIKNLPIKITKSEDNLLLYKSPLPDSRGYKIFIGKAGYPLEDILRDILRFLIMDGIILLPFFFMGRFFVRETLKPIGDNIDAMNHFIHDAGHELKTPLAIMSGNLQLIRDTKAKDMGLIEESIGTLHGMSDSLDGLLELSSLKLPKDIKGINLTELIDGEIAKYQDQLNSKNISIEKHIRKGVKVSIDAKHFSLLFSNLLKNAITYNTENGKIIITYDKNTLSIKDTGIGMKADELSHIWERFYRVDRSGKTNGSGIGLSIVERIIKLYNWDVAVESSPGVGTTFSITTK